MSCLDKNFVLTTESGVLFLCRLKSLAQKAGLEPVPSIKKKHLMAAVLLPVMTALSAVWGYNVESDSQLVLLSNILFMGMFIITLCYLSDRKADGSFKIFGSWSEYFDFHISRYNALDDKRKKEVISVVRDSYTSSSDLRNSVYFWAVAEYEAQKSLIKQDVALQSC